MIKAFSEVFTPEVRDEAQRLFDAGRVEVLAIEDTFLQASTWNFAVLQYTDGHGNLVEIPARLLTKMWLLKTPEGQLRLELLYENLDYASIDIRTFSLLRSRPGMTSIDVPIVRASIDGMAFPAMR